MKKTMIATLAVFGATVLFSTGVLGAGQSAGTEGKIQYDDGKLVINPNPTDPTDPTIPIDPETGEPDHPQPGGNINSRLPENLNFGYHPIQKVNKETWTAKNVNVPTGEDVEFNGLVLAYQGAGITKGALLVEDNRSDEGDWEVKVTQPNKFHFGDDANIDANTLGATKLSIALGDIWNNLDDIDGITKNSAGEVVIEPTNTAVDVLSADANKGGGLTKLNLEKFDLEIPANTDKEQEVYTADLNWTVSNTP